MTTTRKPAARKPAKALTAHVGYRPAGVNTYGYRVKEGYHAVADQATPVGRGWTPSVLTRHAGQALCGAWGPWHAAPEGLFPPLVSCDTCREVATREHITITGLPDSIAGRR